MSVAVCCENNIIILLGLTWFKHQQKLPILINSSTPPKNLYNHQNITAQARQKEARTRNVDRDRRPSRVMSEVFRLRQRVMGSLSREFPKIGDSFLGVPIIRIIVSWVLY